ncbi:hypothetical protein CU098_013762 [Rhizopus stolonifer]|uniref:SGNH hydrolase-type esterase domain-containing protein n=1 Tax=Rhizopus stolonifer TaxID=4846 RepID=A0A367KXV7_RHIST|nr:hypothetical protein CU098_013762 [Rhizopus stolonifer]
MKLNTAVLLLVSVSYVYSMGANDISGCPPLPKRAPPTSVFDLRADDIKVIAALGDSVTAALAAVNVGTEYVNPQQFREYRGQSLLMGGDPGAQSLANYIKYYQNDLVGASEGVNDARYCPDHLNAAQTGSSSEGLDNQVDYILKYVGRSTRLYDEWKMVNIYIGYNDISAFCLPGKSPQKSGENVFNAIKRLVDNLDKTFINVLTVEHYNQLITIPYDHPGYVKPFRDGTNIRSYECICCSKEDVSTMGQQVDEYNSELSKAVDRANDYISDDLIGSLLESTGLKQRKNVAVALQPLDLNKNSVPYDSFSNLDGFHPNLKTHKFASRLLWRQMYYKRQDKLSAQNFDEEFPVYCPTAEDRFQA